MTCLLHRELGSVHALILTGAEARRTERFRRKHGWDNPGRPGKGRRQLVPPSPPFSRKRNATGNITSSSGRCHDRSSNMIQELGGEARSETASEPSQARRKFRSASRRRDPEGLVATAQTRTQSRFPAGRPRQKAPFHTSGARKGGATAGRERARQSP